MLKSEPREAQVLVVKIVMDDKHVTCVNSLLLVLLRKERAAVRMKSLFIYSFYFLFFEYMLVKPEGIKYGQIILGFLAIQCTASIKNKCRFSTNENSLNKLPVKVYADMLLYIHM